MLSIQTELNQLASRVNYLIYYRVGVLLARCSENANLEPGTCLYQTLSSKWSQVDPSLNDCVLELNFYFFGAWYRVRSGVETVN